MERFRDMLDHPHKLIVCGQQDHASCHKVANGCHSVVETERKCCRGAPYVVFWREGSSSRKPCHVASVGKGEVTLVLPGLLGSKGDTGLALKPPIAGADGGRGWMVRWANANSPPTVTMKSRSPKHTCAPKT